MAGASRKGEAHIGCSGWEYPEWRGIVYPEKLPKRQWFEHYAAMFDTVELNSTFYRLPSAAAVDEWAKAAPGGFVYSVKLGQFGSHRMKLRDAASWLPNHLERVERLGAHLGPTLVHLPPRWKRNPERLEEFFDAAPSRVRWAVEFRDPSWLHDDVFDVLARHRAALCIHDLLEDHPWERTTDWAYIRFHGPEAVKKPYHGQYTGRRLWRPADRLRSWLDDGADVYAYFNNDVEANSVRDARWLADRLESGA